MAEENRKYWQVPPYGSPLTDVHQWFLQQVNDGVDYNESSPGFQQLEESIRILSGQPDRALSDKQRDGKYTRLGTNRMKRNLREMVNSLSEIRYNPGYHSNSTEFHDFANTLNQVGFHWYINEFIDLKIKKAIQWAAICPCGWLEICYREIPGHNGKQEIDLIPMSWFDVVMTGVPDDGDYQQAYTVTIIKDLPVYLAHALWPDHQADLVPDRETPTGWMERVKDKAKQIVRSTFDTAPEKVTAKNPTCRLYYQYVIDLSVNRSGKELKMGFAKQLIKDATGKITEQEIATPWSYVVPSVGMDIPDRYNESGQMLYRRATAKECRKFPGRRLIVGNEKKTIYDGPMFDWHGKIPLIKICGDAWPFAEYSMVHDVAPIHDAVNEIDRISHQTLRNRFNPTILYNQRAITRDKAKTVRADVQGERIGYNGQEVQSAGQALTPLFDKSFNVIDTWVENFYNRLDASMDYQMGVRDISALSKMKIGAGSDSIEKALEMAGPIVRGMSRDMERSMRDLADMFKYLVLQYKTTPELIYIVGPDGITPTNFDYQPGNLIPSHLPGERKEKPSLFGEMHRAKWVAEHAKFIIMPGTLHEITQTTQKMLFLQLYRAGFPIDPWTLSDVLRLGNFGKKPDGANTMVELWMAWQKMQLEFKSALSAEAQALAVTGDGSSPNAPDLGPNGGAKGSGGRAASGQKPPQMATKDGGARTTIKESR